MRARVCVIGGWVYACAAELVSLPMRACACMHVCVDRGTPGMGWVGAERDRDMLHRDAPGGWVPKNTISPMTFLRTLPNVFRDQRPSKKLPEKAAFWAAETFYAPYDETRSIIWSSSTTDARYESPRLLERWVHWSYGSYYMLRTTAREDTRNEIRDMLPCIRSPSYIVSFAFFTRGSFHLTAICTTETSFKLAIVA